MFEISMKFKLNDNDLGNTLEEKLSSFLLLSMTFNNRNLSLHSDDVTLLFVWQKLWICPSKWNVSLSII